MTNNQVSIYKDVIFGELTPQNVETIKQTIAKDCSNEQFSLFMSIAKSSGANPLLQEIFPTVRSGQLTVQFGAEFYVRKAKETEGFLGYDVQLVHENDEFKMHQERSEDGRYYMVVDEHSFGFPRGQVIGGYVFAYKEGMQPFTVLMEVDEVEHLKKSNIGMQKTMWNNYFNDMFKKHMVRRALKAAFGLQFGEEDVVASPNSDESYERPPRKDITPNEQPKKEVGSTSNDQEQDPLKAKKLECMAKFKQLGLNDNPSQTEYMKKNYEDALDNPSIKDLEGLIAIMDMDIERKKFEADDLPE